MFRVILAALFSVVWAVSATAATFSYSGSVIEVVGNIPASVGLPPVGAAAMVDIDVTPGVAFTFPDVPEGISASVDIPGFASGDLDGALTLDAFSEAQGFAIIALGASALVDPGPFSVSPVVVNGLGVIFNTPLPANPTSTDDLLAAMAGASGFFTLDVEVASAAAGPFSGTIAVAFGPNIIPLPASAGLLLVGLGGLVIARRARRKA